MAIGNDPQLDRAFQALAHKTRRDILARLMSEPGLSAGALADQFDAAQPTISRHLSQLEQAGLIERKVKGRSHLFVVKAPGLTIVEAWLKEHRAFWAGSLDRLGQLLDEGDA